MFVQSASVYKPLFDHFLGNDNRPVNGLQDKLELVLNISTEFNPNIILYFFPDNIFSVIRH